MSPYHDLIPYQQKAQVYPALARFMGQFSDAPALAERNQSDSVFFAQMERKAMSW